MKKILIIVSAAIAILFSFSLLDIEGNKAKAATVGEQLKEPESGWQRFDDTHSAIKYTNFPHLGYKVTQAYKGTTSFNANYSTHGEVRFKFKGKNLRIITPTGAPDYRASSVDITIDGITESFSMVLNNQYMNLSYEKLGLDDKVHEVVIDNFKGGRSGWSLFGLDAIDIDTDGTLIHPDLELAESLKLNKETLELTTGSSETLVATVTPDSAGLIWTSSDPEIASVDSNGNVIGKKVGKVTITVATTDGSNLTATAEVTVKEDGTGEIGTRAILRLTMTNKDIHEYDLSLSEIDQFMNWLDGREVGQGKPYYKFKLNVTTGNIISRTEYIMYDKIVSFTVDNYK
ncbi:Ig-like domain-containing protein [Lysinibacillus fusiformis]|uniref:Ig-like domain-containing protein n=1 Tax=Lysinibacillus fusiformis TaxID=28031 RepID=UPI000D345C2F|nr:MULTISPECIES: Ig-like domain-containing protein [Lysinibacillus]MED4670508.1 Ig-like domain-containing protein [Lysinibacillus fusiformis]QAS56743.1 cytochrome C biogenesis protein CcmH [Lysinibacillus sphaericus]RDV32262.1 cytochrome C biogenesis protein CcmH [Lysinibacillus fusiformis]GED62721.1 hypothetical protein LFU01_11730 [Lysinibacillus fusiformis]